jgi:hypothetical protein
MHSTGPDPDSDPVFMTLTTIAIFQEAAKRGRPKAVGNDL